MIVVVVIGLVAVVCSSNGDVVSPSVADQRQSSDVPCCGGKCTCSVYLKIVNCRDRQLLEIPPDIPTSATLLYLSNNSITTIPAHVFQNLTNLTEISLLSNKIGTIDDDGFAGLRNLKSLFLRNNKLTSLSAEIFRDLVFLRNLYLTNNLLQAVPNLKYAKNLIKLLLDNNKLKSANFCEDFQMLKNLSTIGLSINPLSRIDDSDTVGLPTSIRAIHLSRTNLETIGDNVFSRFPKLQSVSLSYIPASTELGPWDTNTLKAVINSMANCSGLSSLDLSGTIMGLDLPADIFAGLSQVPLRTLNLRNIRVNNAILNGTFSYFPMLELLDLGSAAFTQLADDLSTLTKLQKVILSRNKKLASAPILASGSLTFLDLSRCPSITRLTSQNFIGLSKLSTLLLNDCGIYQIKMDAFSGLVELTALDLSGNKIGSTGLSSALFNSLVSLRWLNLRRNKLINIKQQRKLFAQLTKLQTLDLSDNQCIFLVPGVFQPLVQLVTLNLSGNRLGDGEAETLKSRPFDGLNSLRSLSLDRNNIRDLPSDLFYDLTSLLVVSASGNQLQSWDGGSFNESANLSMLDFSFNRISIVSSSSILQLPSTAVRLNLTGNKFACGCDLIWFRRWISSTNESVAHRLPGLASYQCSSPEAMIGRTVLQFDPYVIMDECFPPPLLSIMLVVALLISAFFIMIYRYRWPIRLRLYYVKKWLCGPNQGQTSGYRAIEGSGYDLLVSYLPEDDSGQWVRDVLTPSIDRDTRDHRNQNGKNEDNLAQRDLYNVFYEDNLNPGVVVIGELAEAMSTARRVMIVVTDDYLADCRRRYEVAMATERGPERIILLLFNDESLETRLPETLRCLIPGALHWPSDSVCGQQLFWEKLRQYLRTPDDDNVDGNRDGGATVLTDVELVEMNKQAKCRRRHFRRD